MSFVSFQFIAFFVMIYLINWIYVGKCKLFKQDKYKGYKVILVLESYVFILISDWKTAVCLIILTILCYFIARGIEKYETNEKMRGLLLGIGVIFSVGQLVFYKYCNFLIEIICGVTRRDNNYNLNIYLPLGISFFTFSAIGYMIDIYRKKYCAFQKFDEIVLYLAFFPKLISGPIVRADHFIQQIRMETKAVSLSNLHLGIQYVLWGFIKKVVIADHLAIFVNDVYLNPGMYSSATCVWAILTYTLQIYFDFAGYSDMAIGLAKMLGIDIDKNFDLPYISKNVTEFWKRWHISLSSWLQDYLYISLGGNRKGKIRTYFNLILTMLIGGLWHGASWNFIIWGGIHGIALVIHKLYMKWKKNQVSYKESKLKNAVAIAVTFIFINITWVFFRADSFSVAITMLGQAVSFENGIVQIYAWTYFAIFFMICEIIFAKICMKKKGEKRITVTYPILNLNKIKELTIFFTLAGLAVILAYIGQTAFLYGKF